MTLPVRIPRAGTIAAEARNYFGYVRPFLARVHPRWLWPPMLVLKTIEFAVYRWYTAPVRRTYEAPPVRELIYKITSTCTDRCAKCGIWREQEVWRAPVETVERCLVALAPALGRFTVTGGEPLLFTKDVMRLARAASGVSVPMTVVSNGVLIDDAFLREYRGLGHVLVLSVDTLDPAKWRNFRGRDHHDVVMENLRCARAILGKQLKVQSVLAAETIEDVAAVASYCAANGIEHLVQPWTDFGGGWSPAPHARDDASAECDAWRNVCVMPNGDVVRCFDHTRIELAREPLGNLTRESVLSILVRTRTRDVTHAMRGCRLPCRQLSCNLREAA